MRNFLSLSSMAGTDAAKADTRPELYLKIIQDKFEPALFSSKGVNLDVPYMKVLADQLYNDRFFPEDALIQLEPNPTLQAGIMEISIKLLCKYGVLTKSPKGVVQQSTDQQLAQAAEGLITKAHDRAESFTPMLRSVLEEISFGGLKGEDKWMKSKESIAKELKRELRRQEGRTLEEVAAGFNEALRYSVVFQPEQFTDGYRKVMAALEKQGFRALKVENNFVDLEMPFGAISVIVDSDNDQNIPAEIQFQTPVGFQHKENYYDNYERASWLSKEDFTRRQIRSVLKPAFKAFFDLKRPPGYHTIYNWDAIYDSGSAIVPKRRDAGPQATRLATAATSQSGSR